MLLRFVCIAIYFAASPFVLVGSLQAQQRCPGNYPNDYPDYYFGEILSGLKYGCIENMNSLQLVFSSGFARAFIEDECSVNLTESQRSTLNDFLQSSIWDLTGPVFSQGEVGEFLSQKFSNVGALTAGTKTFQHLGGCENPTLPLLMQGLILYLDYVNSRSTYVDGCEKYYRGRHTRNECECLAERGSLLISNLKARDFSPDTIDEMVKRNFVLASGILLVCGMGDY